MSKGGMEGGGLLLQRAGWRGGLLVQSYLTGSAQPPRRKEGGGASMTGGVANRSRIRIGAQDRKPLPAVSSR